MRLDYGSSFWLQDKQCQSSDRVFNLLGRSDVHYFAHCIDFSASFGDKQTSKSLKTFIKVPYGVPRSVAPSVFTFLII